MIPDAHARVAAWGVRPTLFTVAGHDVASYSFFVVLGLVAALALYHVNTRTRAIGGAGLTIAAAAAVGGILGAKLPIWVVNAPRIFAEPSDIALLLSGRTIVGGIIGGALAVYLVKRRLGIRERLGNFLVPSLCAGIFFGRIGCFLAGCCHGTPTTLAWGVDFGDGVLRHPTQLYEALFVLALFAYAQATLHKHRPGSLFRIFMVAYFAWRFFAEFLRVNPVAFASLTYYQLASLAVVIHYVVKGAVGSLEGARRWT